jgi:hypothetical protein
VTRIEEVACAVWGLWGVWWLFRGFLLLCRSLCEAELRYLFKARHRGSRRHIWWHDRGFGAFHRVDFPQNSV